jgi:hypothetical protein
MKVNVTKGCSSLRASRISLQYIFKKGITARYVEILPGGEARGKL